MASSRTTRNEDSKRRRCCFLFLVGKCLTNGASVSEAMKYYPLTPTPNVTVTNFHSLFKSLVDTAKHSMPKRVTSICYCTLCQNFMVKPVTVPCGHTFCQRCIMNLKGCSCAKCGYIYDRSELKINVVILKLLEKWWPALSNTVKLINEANDLVASGDISEGIQKLHEVCNTDPVNEQARCCLSVSLLLTEKDNEAIDHANAVIRLNPASGKAYLLRGHAQVRLGFCHDAILSYLYCLLFDYATVEVNQELLKLLEKLFHKSLQQESSFEGTDQSMNTECSSAMDVGNISNTDEVNWVQERECFQGVVENYMQALSDTQSNEVRPEIIIPEYIDKHDLDCPLCLRLLWEPVTVPCGHMFCRKCLDRSLDHSSLCPMCKSPLNDYLAERRQYITEFVEQAMQNYLPVDYDGRRKKHEEELEEIAKVLKDPTKNVPIFVCTVIMPHMNCPLHVFEPRYRLMTRQCLETGFRQFGMCGSIGTDKSIATYGTLLNIREIQFTPDGSSILQTVGGARFKVLHLNLRDGYHVGNIEYLYDAPVEPEDVAELVGLHSTVYAIAEQWFQKVPSGIKNQLTELYGSLPAAEPDYVNNRSGPKWVWWLATVLPLEEKEKLTLLAMNSLSRRLKTLYVCVSYLLKESNSELKQTSEPMENADPNSYPQQESGSGLSNAPGALVVIGN